MKLLELKNYGIKGHNSTCPCVQWGPVTVKILIELKVLHDLILLRASNLHSIKWPSGGDVCQGFLVLLKCGSENGPQTWWFWTLSWWVYWLSHSFHWLMTCDWRVISHWARGPTVRPRPSLVTTSGETRWCQCSLRLQHHTSQWLMSLQLHPRLIHIL